MQSVRLERIMAVANTLIDDYDGVPINYEIDDDYPRDEEDNENIFSVQFTKDDTDLCRLFNDHELWMDDNVIVLEDDYDNVRRVIPNFSTDISHLIKSKKSDQEIQEFLKFIQLQIINFGADDEVDE